MNCNIKKNQNKRQCIARKNVGEARFSLILPKNDNSGKPIKLKVLNKYIQKVNDVFGGSTTVPTTKGCYVDKDVLMCENGFEVTAVRDFESKYDKSLRKLNSNQRINRIKKDYSELKKVAKEAGKELGQDSVMVVSDYINDASFISGKWLKGLPKSKLGNKEIFD